MKIKSHSPARGMIWLPAIGLAALLSGCGGSSDSSTADTATPFGVSETLPAANAELVSIGSAISATFNDTVAWDSVTAKSFRLECPEFVSVSASLSLDDEERIVTLTPDKPLPENKTCIVSVTDVTDADGQPLSQPVSWTFNTNASAETLEEGKQIFRYDTFGDEIFWTDVLQMHTVVETAVDPVTALTVAGLKVDSEALPPNVVEGILNESISLTDPATTVALIELNAVVGIKGTVEDGKITRLGVTCALCHSTVDDSFSPGIGKRLDGWPNRDLNPGLIISLSPALDPDTKAIYASWGPGMYDARFNFDGISSPHVITPAYGLNGIHKTTTTGDGDDIAYWNRYVGVTQMGGQGFFYDQRTGVVVQNGTEDLISAKLPALQAYQLSLLAPEAPEGSFNVAAAARGEVLFNGQAQCASCHTGSKFTDANTRLHGPEDVVSLEDGLEPDGTPGYASRTATKQYRTAPLEGIWQHPPYFHNGVAATLGDVVDLYDDKLNLALNSDQKLDLVEYLKSL
jgi:mono/diheme cytochrome c family protein